MRQRNVVIENWSDYWDDIQDWSIIECLKSEIL